MSCDKQTVSHARNNDRSGTDDAGDDPRSRAPVVGTELTGTVMRYSSLLDRFIHPGILTRDVSQVQRARLVAVFCLALVVLGAIYAVIFWLLGSPVGAASLAFGILTAFAALAVLRYFGWQEMGGNLLAAAFFGTLTALGCRLGGQGAHAFAWYVAVPVAAMITVGRRSGFFWLAVVVVSLGVFHGFYCLGWSFPNDLAPSSYELLGTLSWSGLAMLVLGLALLYHMAKDQMLADQVRMEQALRVSEERRTLAMSVTNDGMFDWRIETGAVYFDDRYYTMAGYEPGEFPEAFEEWSRRVHPDDIAYVEQYLQDYFAEAKPDFDVEFRFKRRDGAWMWIRGRAKIVAWDESGKPIRLVGTHTDITERRRAEEELRSYSLALEAANKDLELLSQAAEASNRAKSEFLANMSHEIRTPMTAILGFSELLAESITDSRHLDMIGTVKLNGEHLLQIINDILDLSKIEAGKLDVECSPCSPCQVLADVVAMMDVRAKKKGLDLRLEYEGTIPRTIQSDPTRLRQILINLAGNAVKFTSSGEVRLVARLSESESGSPKLEVDVIDTGVGMTDEQVGRLFVPFQQADTSTTRKYGGTGLGLAISKRLAQSLGGDIVVESDLGRGSKFTMTVDTGPLEGVEFAEDPTEVKVSLAPTDHPAVQDSLVNCRVLLAEDGSDNRRLISLLLKKAGVEVEQAENGLAAHDLAMNSQAEGTPFDVILMDMQMPIMDGYEATRRLRDAGYAGPVIALTAHAMSHRPGEVSGCRLRRSHGQTDRSRGLDLADIEVRFEVQFSSRSRPNGELLRHVAAALVINGAPADRRRARGAIGPFIPCRNYQFLSIVAFSERNPAMALSM